MTVKQSIEFTAKNQTKLFDDLKQRQFNGQLLLADSKGQKWTFDLFLGRIIYATGGTHPVRRWKRNLAVAAVDLPEIPSQILLQPSSVAGSAAENFSIGWEYRLLCLWVDQKEITREQVAKMVGLTLVEVLFDLSQAVGVTYELRESHSLSAGLVSIDAEQAIALAQRQWQAWQAAKLTDFSPNMALAIAQPEQLQQRLSTQHYQRLIKLGNGQQTLHDIAVQLKRNVVSVTRSLLPYIQLGLLELVSIRDLSPPVSLPVSETLSNKAEGRGQEAEGMPVSRSAPDRREQGSNTPTSSSCPLPEGVESPASRNPLPSADRRPPSSTTEADVDGPLIACVDDSPLICYVMETIIKKASYRFVGVSDSLQAVSILSACKPDLIFLDLVMPNASGYEICRQLRQLSCFLQTPIVILTGNDGIIDRVRAKIVGSSDFLSKPVNAESVLGVIRKHIKRADKLTPNTESEIRYRGRPIQLNANIASKIENEVRYRGRPTKLDFQ